MEGNKACAQTLIRLMGSDPPIHTPLHTLPHTRTHSLTRLDLKHKHGCTNDTSIFYKSEEPTGNIRRALLITATAEGSHEKTRYAHE